MLRSEVSLQWTSWPQVLLSVRCERTLTSEQLRELADVAESIEGMRERVLADDAERLAP